MPALKSIVSRLRRATATGGSPSGGQYPGRYDGLGPDIISRLPFELRLLVLDHLDGDHLVTALNVCRAWRIAWLNDEVWPLLASRWDPGLVDHIRALSHPGSGTTSATSSINTPGSGQGGGGGVGRRDSDHYSNPNPDLGETFRRIMVKIQSRRHGRFDAALRRQMRVDGPQVFRLSKRLPIEQGGVHCIEDIPDFDFEQEPICSRFMMYNHGRMAWWPGSYGLPYLAIVDDFRSRERRVYQFPDHQGEWQGYKTALGDKLFVMGRGTVLHAWHLELDCLRSVDLPKRFERCVTEGEAVLIVSCDAEVYIWNFGHDLQNVNMAQFPCYTLGPVSHGHSADFPPEPIPSHRRGLRLRDGGMFIDFIIHPADKNVFFAITLTPGPPRRLVVYEFWQAKLVNSYEPSGGGVLYGRNVEDPPYLRWEKMDSYGGYCLTRTRCNVPGHSRQTEQRNTTTHAVCPGKCADSPSILSVGFNVYSKLFTELFHHPPAWPDDLVGEQIWDGQMHMVDYYDEGHQLLLALDHCREDKPQGEVLPAAPIYECKRDDAAQERRSLYPETLPRFCKEDGVRYAFTSSLRSPLLHHVGRRQPTEPLRALGDDDFLLFVHSHSYSLWSFSGNLPTEKDGRGEKTSWFKKLREA